MRGITGQKNDIAIKPINRRKSRLPEITKIRATERVARQRRLVSAKTNLIWPEAFNVTFIKV